MTPLRPDSRRRTAGIFLALVLFALTVRLVAVVALAGLAPETNDRVLRYDPIALNLLAGEGFSRSGRPTAVSPPVYPLFLAAVYGVHGHSEGAARTALAVVDAATVGVVFLLGRRLFGTRAGVLAGLGAALLPYSIVQIVMGGSDTLFLFLHTLFLAVLVGAWLSGRRGAYAAAGALLGVATLCRAVPLLLPVALTALVVTAGRARPRERVWRAALLALAFAAVVSPWIVRNWLVFDRFVPVQTLGGFHLYLATVDAERPIEESDRTYRPYEGGVERDRRFLARGLERIRNEPAAYAVGTARRLVGMWSKTHSGRWDVWLLPSNAALLTLAAAGVAMARSRWRLLPMLTVFGYYVALHAVLLAIFRYLLPVVPILLVLAAVPLASLLGDRSLRSSPGEPQPS